MHSDMSTSRRSVSTERLTDERHSEAILLLQPLIAMMIDVVGAIARQDIGQIQSARNRPFTFNAAKRHIGNDLIIYKD